MATLTGRVAALAAAIGNYVRDSILPRLVPVGGGEGQLLGKASNDDHDLVWINAGGSALPVGSLTSVDMATKSFLAIVNAGDGEVNFLQDSFLQKSIAFMLPTAGASNTSSVGMRSSFSGTTTARVRSFENLFMQARRVGCVSSTASSAGGIRETDGRHAIGQGNGIGGFFVSIKFGISDAVMVPSASMFVGLSNSPNPWGTFNLVGLNHCYGVGCNSGQTTLSLTARGPTGAAHVIDLGPNFPCNTANEDWYHLILYSPSNEPNRIFYHITREGTEHFAAGELLPESFTPPATSMVMWCARANHGTALATGLDIGHMYAQSDN